ncbi:hypothetical protein [Streptomyces sp. NPDC102476]|uniref:hypothetical protein n=1 Tax=Streptomyces sp. NPDC102476 TaxID=3366181 RepID=UPI0037F15386
MALIPGNGPTPADWLGAWSTFGAAVGTVGAFFTGLSLWWRDRRRLRRAQARLVHGHILHTGTGIAVSQGGSGASARTPPKYVIENNSDEPIYRVTVPQVADGDTIFYQLVPAGEKRETSMSGADKEKFLQKHPKATVVPLAFSFADSSSALWKRNQGGRLHGGWRYRWPRKKLGGEIH